MVVLVSGGHNCIFMNAHCFDRGPVCHDMPFNNGEAYSSQIIVVILNV